jgi:hypothetical protein
MSYNIAQINYTDLAKDLNDYRKKFKLTLEQLSGLSYNVLHAKFRALNARVDTENRSANEANEYLIKLVGAN